MRGHSGFSPPMSAKARDFWMAEHERIVEWLRTPSTGS